MELGWLGHWLERGRLRPGLCNRPELGPGKQLLVSCVLLPRVLLPRALLPRALLSGLLSCIALLFAGRSLCLWLLQPILSGFVLLRSVRQLLVSAIWQYLP